MAVCVKVGQSEVQPSAENVQKCVPKRAQKNKKKSKKCNYSVPKSVPKSVKESFQKGVPNQVSRTKCPEPSVPKQVSQKNYP